MINDAPEESVFEDLKGAYKTVAEQVCRFPLKMVYLDAYITQNKIIETLRLQIVSLKNSRCTLSRENVQMSQELEILRGKIGESSAKINLLQDQLEQNDAALNAKVLELTNRNEDIKAKEEEVSQLMERLEQVSKGTEEIKTAYTQEVARGEGLSAQLVNSNKDIQELVKG